MKPTIQFIFGLGYRCYSVDFLNLYKLRKMSSPFDYLYIDLETAFKVIHNRFDDYLHDIVLFNRSTTNIGLYYNKNTTLINKNFYELLEKDIGYMGHNYNENYLLFNQNYLNDEKFDNNLYNWKNIFCFLHHNILDINIYNTLNKRCERFNKVIDNYNETTALFYITKIIHCENIVDYMNGIVELKKKYGINCFLILIIHCDNVEDNTHYNEEDKCLFIIKKGDDYETQNSKYKIDNDMPNNDYYKKEFDIISNYFTFDPIEKNDVV